MWRLPTIWANAMLLHWGMQGLLLLEAGSNTAQWLMMCYAVCGFPQTHSGESFKPHWNMFKLKRPTPVRWRFKVTHFFLDRFVPGGRLVSGVTVNCLGRFILFQKSLQVSKRSKSALIRFDAWREKGCREVKRWRFGCWASVTKLWRRCWSFHVAFRASRLM